MRQQLSLAGDFFWTLRRPSGLLVANGNGFNRVVNVSLNGLLDVLRGTAFPSAWHIGLIDSIGFSAIAAGDTMSSHSGWTEFTSYSEGTRPAWTIPAATSQETGNAASPANFTCSASGTVRGFFVASDSTKGGSSGTLLAAGELSSSQAFSIAEIFTAIYRLQASSGA